jgi:hypothetical protein
VGFIPIEVCRKMRNFIVAEKRFIEKAGIALSLSEIGTKKMTVNATPSDIMLTYFRIPWQDEVYWIN